MGECKVEQFQVLIGLNRIVYNLKHIRVDNVVLCNKDRPTRRHCWCCIRCGRHSEQRWLDGAGTTIRVDHIVID